MKSSSIYGAESIFHSTESLILPGSYSLKIYGGFPYSSWQTLDVILADSDVGVHVIGNKTKTIFNWDYLNSIEKIGGCGTLTPYHSFHKSNEQNVNINIIPTCNWIPIPPPMFEYEFNPVVGSFLFPEETPLNYPIQSIPKNFSLGFSFNHSNCGNEISFRRERIFIETLKVAGFSEDKIFSICNITYDTLRSCVNYTCNGNFLLPDGYEKSKREAIELQITQGVAIDAIATGVDILGSVMELIILPYLL